MLARRRADGHKTLFRLEADVEEAAVVVIVGEGSSAKLFAASSCIASSDGLDNGEAVNGWEGATAVGDGGGETDRLGDVEADFEPERLEEDEDDLLLDERVSECVKERHACRRWLLPSCLAASARLLACSSTSVSAVDVEWRSEWLWYERRLEPSSWSSVLLLLLLDRLGATLSRWAGAAVENMTVLAPWPGAAWCC